MKPLILIVEDNHGLASVMAVMLEPVYESCIVHSLEAAINLLGSGMTIHAVLLDLNLPDSQGTDTFDAVLAATKIPIIATSGRDEEELRDMVKDAGETYLRKPYAAQMLINAVTEALRRG